MENCNNYHQSNYLSEKELEYYKNLLIKKRSSILKQERDSISTLNKTSDLYGADIIENSQFDQSADVVAIRGSANIKLLKAIDFALSRMKNGKFAMDFKTGEFIGKERLDKCPWTTKKVHRECSKSTNK